MNIIIAGDGEVGLHLAKMLSGEKHSITVVDPHEELMEVFESSSDLMAIPGDSTCISVLQDANVHNADLLISVVHDEKINILTAIMGKRLGAKKTIARLNNPDNLTEEKKKIYKSLGIDYLICPENIAAMEIVRLLNQAAATETFDFSDGKLSLYLFTLEKKAPVIGKSLIDVVDEFPFLDFRVVAIYRDGKTIIPKGNDVFKEGDQAYVITKPVGIDQLLKLGGKEKINIQNIMIAGGGRIGRMTAKRLEKKFNIKLIDMDRQRCVDLSDSLTNTLLVHGDVRAVELLEEEGIRGMDAFIAVTNNSETNIFTCMLAKKYGVKKTIASVENIDYIDISKNMGIDTIINKKLITASHIVRFTMDALVTSLKCLCGVDAEVLEFVVKSKSLVVQKKILEINFPKDAIIGGIVRGNDSFIATGNFRIFENDKVVVFSLPKAISKVTKLFN